MAVIGNVYKLEQFFKEKNLEIIFNYFKQAIDESSDIHKRIFNLPVGSFIKEPITDEVFALEQVFYTKDREECFIESHKKYGLISKF